VLIRELVVQGVRQMAAAASVVIPAGRLGKAKTLATLAAIALLLLAFDAQTGGPMSRLDPAGALLGTAGVWLMVAATALTVISGLEYLRGAGPLLLGRSR
jgi:CDP-diacylglycerol--glycerol-3-phosphate 3-phosphatidyltransferase